MNEKAGANEENEKEGGTHVVTPDIDKQHYIWGNFESCCQMSLMTHQDFQVHVIIVNHSYNANNMDTFDVLISHPLTITSLLI